MDFSFYRRHIVQLRRGASRLRSWKGQQGMLRDETGARRAAKDSDPEDKAKPGHLEALVTVQRTMDIFEMLADQVEGLPISDIARELKVNKSIAFRILSSLKQAG